MATVSIRIPQLGEGLREAYLVDFLKTPGDAVLRDEPLFTMETDKAVSDVESPHAGTLVKWLVEVDSVLEIGTEIAIIETASTAKSSQSTPRPYVNRAGSAPAHDFANLPANSPVTTSADAINEASRSGAGTAFEMQPEPAVLTLDDSVSTSLIPPKTRRYLKAHNLMDVVGRISTKGRKMSIADVELFVAAKNAAITAPALVHDPLAEIPVAPNADNFELVPLPKSQIRLNYRLTQAAATCVPVTLINEWNWEKIEHARNQSRPVQGPTAFAMACWCIAKAAKIHQRFRSALTNDGRSWRVFKSVNLGIAVSMEGDQLVTATVPNADQLTIEEFYAAYSESIALARTGVDQADESTTLMVSNIGNIGMTIGIPAIVAPAVATLAIGQAIDKPVRDGNSFRFERAVTATLCFDHRIANGIGAAAFLNDVRSGIESFEI